VKRNKIRRLIGFLIVLAGLTAMNYPLLAGVVNDIFAYRERQGYQLEIDNTDEQELQQTLETAREYNAALVSGAELSKYGGFKLLQTGAMLGYAEIPRINVNMAVRYSTDDDVLKSSLGLVESSSLPVGGESTHAVISGHTGLASKKMLTELTQMKLGDLFFLHVLGQDMAYRVDQIVVVEPWDASELAIVEGKDYVTLLTCTPYGINDHRLLVRGERVDYDFIDPEESPTVERSYSTVELARYAIAGVSVIVLIGMIIGMARSGRKAKKGKEPNGKTKRTGNADEKKRN